ncbi:protein NEDD1 [Cryptomeria japonica]|uniref:protein NEDD1 n=1 Tax=Cryptomeria japonica TaxID=3369 RepID=UPI0025AC9B7B|nr:protein NEDD1 [Cryptomeria japonica]
MAGINSMLAASAGDTIKIFDISDDAGDPCILQYTPTPGKKILQVKWNHTNLVVASAGEDNKISLWKVSGQSLGVVPQSGSDVVGNIDESILGICFNSKSSRYLCSGGTGKVVRVWDLQRQRCIKWLKGHTDSIAGITYNCKGECLASISYNGNLLLHNLASATRATELKDPHAQVLRVLDNSRTSRHVFVTSGDEGSVHLWDTTARSPKVSWTKQHSAPTTGVCFCPNNDKMIVSVGFDKKLYAFDSTSKKPAYCIPCEAPFTSLAFKDDGLTLAAGTCSGSVVFYDVRGGLHPFTILRAYGSSETEEVAAELKMDFEDPLFDEKINQDEDVILEKEEIRRINSFLEVELWEIAEEASLCEGLEMLTAEVQGEERVAAAVEVEWLASIEDKGACLWKGMKEERKEIVVVGGVAAYEDVAEVKCPLEGMRMMENVEQPTIERLVVKQEILKEENI